MKHSHAQTVSRLQHTDRHTHADPASSRDEFFTPRGHRDGRTPRPSASNQTRAPSGRRVTRVARARMNRMHQSHACMHGVRVFTTWSCFIYTTTTHTIHYDTIHQKTDVDRPNSTDRFDSISNGRDDGRSIRCRIRTRARATERERRCAFDRVSYRFVSRRVASRPEERRLDGRPMTGRGHLDGLTRMDG